MAFDFMKRGVLAILLRGIREHLRRGADAQTRIADTLELLLKLEALKVDVSLTALKSAEEGQVPAAEEASVPSMQFVADQSPEELDRLDDAYEHAEQHLGRGKALDGLDLYEHAEGLRPDSLKEEP